jgi:hypothetical protein
LESENLKSSRKIEELEAGDAEEVSFLGVSEV